jgi:hypothetical protein
MILQLHSSCHSATWNSKFGTHALSLQAAKSQHRFNFEMTNLPTGATASCPHPRPAYEAWPRKVIPWVLLAPSSTPNMPTHLHIGESCTTGMSMLDREIIRGIDRVKRRLVKILLASNERYKDVGRARLLDHHHTTISSIFHFLSIPKPLATSVLLC